jgi:DNA helicase II / ATP-dependent DNA helicase PcrA
MSIWTAGLNPEQIKAVEHNSGPLLILAGAGSGKTTVLVCRAGRLLEDQIVSAKELCVLTFTNKAAREIKQRVTKKIGSSAKGIWSSTFHSFGLHWLREFHKKARLSDHFGIMDASDAGALIKEILKDFHYADKTAFDADKILSLISLWRERGQREAKVEDPYEAAVEWALPKYLKRLELLGMVDFDGLILRPLELMEEDDEIKQTIQSAYGQVMVDEFQDTNQMQMQFIRRLVEPHRNITVVGDDDQSIYGWRGACVSNILDFPKLYSGCETIRLERNYRSTASILQLANAVIEKNSKRHGKVLRSEKSTTSDILPELFIYDSEIEEADSVTREVSDFLKEGTHAKKDIAILYRANSQGALLEGELRRLQIPYSTTGGTGFFDRKETRDILAYLRCAIKPNEVAMRRVINTPPRGIGEKTIEELTAFSESKSISFVEAVKQADTLDLEERAKKAIQEFLQLLESTLTRVISDGASAGDRLLSILDEIGYRRYIETYAGNALAATKRWKWVETFARVLDSFIERGGRNITTLKKFVDSMELRDAITENKKEEDRVQLMTLHACKGLEFPIVFLIGLEEDLLPHKTLGLDIAEERRLFYVGITRAQERLILTRAEKRRKYGKWIDSAPSRFLLEIPTDLMKSYKGARPMSKDQRKDMIADLFKKIDALNAVTPKVT